MIGRLDPSAKIFCLKEGSGMKVATGLLHRGASCTRMVTGCGQFGA
jgi:hypothetical protein